MEKQSLEFGISKIILLSFYIFYFFINCTSRTECEFIPQESLYGSWILTENRTALSTESQINYPEIIFRQDSLAIFRSRGDTIFYYSYYLDGCCLYLQNEKYRSNCNQIIKLSNDTLTFKTLIENDKEQKYYRTK